ncbi:hypothetical protein CC1G_13521 [Coprinopsis cinerea okayama7|uniref:Uncharacterized protein n=1 Tax=Coprinopsis cinerea (strain Okayama-7 / 130 / ATCC MYA-4618 / FGSC 9003) TaxID=240176 RepID=A8PH44_COPC7|nr:hypothetical protein CC1G_13521 [Coprinopsis cinerea okayama7\|eukprot:XP_001841337.1 hypothetical protein CC1G_13521 [Coprinopsis cinerea okayama7\
MAASSSAPTVTNPSPVKTPSTPSATPTSNVPTSPAENPPTPATTPAAEASTPSATDSQVTATPAPKKSRKTPKSAAFIADSDDDVEIVQDVVAEGSSSVRGRGSRGRGGRGGGRGGSSRRAAIHSSTSVVRVPFHFVPNLDLTSPAYLKVTSLGKRARISADTRALEEVNKNAITAKYPNLFPDADQLSLNNEWVTGVLSQVQNVLSNYSDALAVGITARAALSDIRSEILRRVHVISMDVRYLEILFAEFEKVQASLEKELPPLEEDDLVYSATSPGYSPASPNAEDLAVDASGDVAMTEV